MTFSYSPGSPDDITRVRYHIGDTVESAARLTDEEIEFAISESKSWQAAVLWSIDRIIGMLADESGQTLDWLEIDRKDAIAAYQRLKRDKTQQLEVTGPASSGVKAKAVYTRRKDRPGN